MLKAVTIKSSLLALACAASLSAHAVADTSRTIDIPAGDLRRALLQVSEQFNAELVYSPEQVRGLKTGGAHGELTTEQAVTKLLEGTSLELRTDPSGAMLIARPGASSGVPRTSTKRGAEAKTFWSRLRLAAADTPAASQVSEQVSERSAAYEADAPARSQKTIELEEIVVTGSHIRGVESTSPVMTFSREEILSGGHITVQDLLMRVPQNFSGQGAATGTGDGNLGYVTTVDLRGLGPEATLTLVNGRRAAAASGNQARAFDISMIPVAAVERVDVLTDGASALYGSDAIGGVVNIVLRKDFTGVETELQYGSGRGDRSSMLASQLAGFAWGSGRVLGAFQYDQRDAITYASTGATSYDLRSRGGGDFRVPGFGSPGTLYSAGFFAPPGQAPQPFQNLSGPNAAPVFFATLPAGDGRNVQPSQLGLNTMTLLDSAPTDVAPEQTNTSVYLTAEQDAGPVTVFADGIFARRRSDLRTMPAITILNVPANNAFNPFGERVMVGYQAAELGTVTAEAESEGWFANLGARGALGASGWTWEIVGSRSHDEFSNSTWAFNNALLASRLASPDPNLAFNPFGDGTGQSSAALDGITVTRSFVGESDMSGASALAQGELLNLPAGALRLAVGAEYREESMDFRVVRTGAPDNVQFPAAERNITAVFVEAYLPIFGGERARGALQELGVSIAGRHEDYSDFGNTSNPKLGLLWRPAAELTFRANWGTSFRAPSLRELVGARTVTPGFRVFDPRNPAGPATVSIEQIAGGNPGLDPEDAETYTVAAEYRPDWLQRSQLSIAYFHTDYEDRIRGGGDGLRANFLLSIEDRLPPGIVTRDANGLLKSINVSNVNSAESVVAGWDFAVDYRWVPTAAWGSFATSASVTLFTENSDQLIQGAPVIDLKGKVANPPEWRGRLNLSWIRDPWGATASVNYTDDLYNHDLNPGLVERSVGSQRTVDLQVSFSPRKSDSMLLHGLTVRVGATNVFDAAAPFVDGANLGLDVRNHIYEGRTVYVRLSKRFGSGDAR